VNAAEAITQPPRNAPSESTTSAGNGVAGPSFHPSQQPVDPRDNPAHRLQATSTSALENPLQKQKSRPRVIRRLDVIRKDVPSLLCPLWQFRPFATPKP